MKRTYCFECGQKLTPDTATHLTCAQGHHTYIDPAPAGVAYVIHDSKVLYGVRSTEPNPGKLNVPGGFVEINESAEASVLREAKEEVGLDVELVSFLGSYPSIYAQGQHILNIVFVARPKGDVQLTPGDDMSGGEPLWRAITDLPMPDELSFAWQVQAQKDLLTWWQNHQDMLH